MQHLQAPIAISSNNDCNIAELRPRAAASSAPSCTDLLAAAKEPRLWRAASARLAARMRMRGWCGGDERTSRRRAQGARPAAGAMGQGQRTARPLPNVGAAAGARSPSCRRGSPTWQDGGGRCRASAGLREEGRLAGEEGLLVLEEFVNHHHDGREGGGPPQPRRAALAVGAQSPRTHHGRRRNWRESKGGATGSQIGARFGRRWPKKGGPTASVVV
jgi:hypothetical protein